MSADTSAGREWGWRAMEEGVPVAVESADKAAAFRRSTEFNVLTNAPGRVASPAWSAASTFVAADESTLWAAARSAWRLYRRAEAYDCVVLGANKTDFFYGVYRRLLPFRKPYTLKLDCLWYLPTSRVLAWLKRFQWRLAAGGIDAFIVWASREVDAYSTAFGIPREKFHFIPYHSTLNDVLLVCRNEGYVFSGGNFGRDFRTLLEAVDGLPVPVEIASTRPELFEQLPIPSNVTIRGYTHEAYLEKMAGCLLNVVCLEGNQLHSGGQQTFLNSMALGKPTIVTDPEGAADYIRHGKDGLLVPAGDPAALRAAILRLLENPALAEGLGNSARKVARNLTTEAHFRAILQFAVSQISEEVPGFKVLSPVEGAEGARRAQPARSSERLEL